MTKPGSDTTIRELETILGINRRLNAEPDPKRRMTIVLKAALKFSGATSGLLFLVNESGELEVNSAVNMAPLNEWMVRYSTNIAYKAIQSEKMFVSAYSLADVRLESPESVVFGKISGKLNPILCFSITSQHRLIGVFYLENHQKTDPFANINLKLLDVFGEQMGLVLENLQQEKAYKELEDRLEETTGQLNEALARLKKEASTNLSQYSYKNIIGRSSLMQNIFRVLNKVAESNLSILLHGASGTGKELTASAIHYGNPQRAAKKFVVINCNEIPANMIERKLFGGKVGSFGGDNQFKKGLFEEANGGTIFIDDVTALEEAVQDKLLRVLQKGEVMPVGGSKPNKVDVRIVCASHETVEEIKNQFQEDLFERLCQIKIRIPALQERPEDIPLLVKYFIEKFCKDNQIEQPLVMDPLLMRRLIDYGWPGNVRELENTVYLACASRSGNLLSLATLPLNHAMRATQDQGYVPDNLKPESKQVALDDRNTYDVQKTWADYEIIILAKCLEANDFHSEKTVAMLGISSATFYRRVWSLHIKDKNNAFLQDPFIYERGTKLKEYQQRIFKAGLEYHNGHPNAASRSLHVSQGYFHKVLKGIRSQDMR